MRLIDADALEARMYHEAFETDSNLQKWDSGCWIRYKMFDNAMAEAPTIDPVKHGKWIEEPNCWFRCTNCGEHYPSLRGYMDYNYCPNCGALMVMEDE